MTVACFSVSLDCRNERQDHNDDEESDEYYIYNPTEINHDDKIYGSLIDTVIRKVAFIFND